MLATPFMTSLGLSCPIVQSPMAGGATTPDLVAAVSNQGALGSLAGSMLAPEAISNAVVAIRQRTIKAFAINLFVQSTPSPKHADVEAAWQQLAPLHEELGIAPSQPTQWCQPFEKQLDVVLDVRPPIASFTFGILDQAQVDALHAHDIQVMGTATHPKEAEAWAAIGADALSLQGVEAGGHRGTFLPTSDAHEWTTRELLKACLDKVDIPLIPAGGLMAGEDIAEMLNLGAQAAQLGTAFLTTHESGIPDIYKNALLTTHEMPEVTRGFSGRQARGLPNRAFRYLKEIEEDVPDYPVQNALTAAIRAEGKRQGKADYLSLWAGTGVSRVKQRAAADLVNDLMLSLESALKEGNS